MCKKKQINKQFIWAFLKLLLVTGASVFLFVGIYFLLKQTGLVGKFNNVQELKQIILSAGFWSYSVFVLLQFLQVTILPLPASVTTIVGVIIFGPLIAFVLSTLAIILGSLFAFILGRAFGTKLLYWIFGKDKAKILQEKIEKGKFVFFFMMLFPFFPDDILCMLAGVINMDFKFFLVTNLITRPVGIFCLCFLGSGVFIPFHSWGLVVWLIIAIIVGLSMLFLFKHKAKVEAFFIKKSVILKTKNPKK